MFNVNNNLFYLLTDFIMNFINKVLLVIQKLLYVSPSKCKAKKICIYKIGNIGDIICAIPAMYKVRQQYPNANITLLSAGGSYINARDILGETVEWLEKIDTYNYHDFKSLISFYRELNNAKFDLLINLPEQGTSFFTQLRNVFFFRFCGIKSAGNFYISRIKLFAKIQAKYKYFPTEVERLINGLPFKSDQNIVFPIYIQQDDVNMVNELLEKFNLINHRDKIMAISFNGKGSAKKWPIINFINIANKWINDGGFVIVMGGENEKTEGDRIVKQLPKNQSINFSGALTIIQSMYLLKCIRFLLTIDTGTAHMASAMGTECIVLYTAFDFPNCWAAYGANIHLIRKNLECSPCLQKECRFGKISRCMEAITVEEVWSIIKNRYNLF